MHWFHITHRQVVHDTKLINPCPSGSCLPLSVPKRPSHPLEPGKEGADGYLLHQADRVRQPEQQPLRGALQGQGHMQTM